MKPYRFKILLIISLFIITSCTPAAIVEENNEQGDTGSEKAEYIKISAEDAKAMMENEGVILVDVRTTEEFEEIRIEGAMLIPDYDIEDLAGEMLPDKEATILVYCRTGRRSEIASKKLIDMGYTSIYDFGGIVDWPFDTVSGK
ncbi:MAG: rhodanese-like domain-containing protein [Dethiobacteria bacterium]|nr:rhodanese-like domain-containing protein [Bacillota bacterium]MDW7729801.1 rhodanese-like domain-containing protein [Bacillota bacterium]